MPSKKPDFEARTITFDFGNAGILTVDCNSFPQAIRDHAEIHGFSQKFGDTYAGAKKATEELDVDPDEWARGQVESAVKQLQSGDWTIRVAGAGGAVTDLVKAFAEVTGQSLEDSAEIVGEFDSDQKKALRAEPQIKAVLDRIRLERQAAKAEASAKAAESAESNLLADYMA